MLRGFFGNLIFAIIARMLCGNHLNILALVNMVVHIRHPLASTVYSGKPTITLHLEQSDRQLSQRNRGWGFMPQMALRRFHWLAMST